MGPFKVEKILIYWLKNLLCAPAWCRAEEKGGAEAMRYRPIRRNNEFGRVYARGKSYVNQALVLYVLKTRGKRTRVGLTATKKIGHAVQRNRARRVMKAAIDEHLDYNIGGYDLVFVARGMTPRLKSWQLSSIVAKLFAQAGLPDKAKRPDAPLPATLPPARKKPTADEKAKA
jgi:ribonuclease P protein component